MGPLNHSPVAKADMEQQTEVHGQGVFSSETSISKICPTVVSHHFPLKKLCFVHQASPRSRTRNSVRARFRGLLFSLCGVELQLYRSCFFVIAPDLWNQWRGVTFRHWSATCDDDYCQHCALKWPEKIRMSFSSSISWAEIFSCEDKTVYDVNLCISCNKIIQDRNTGEWSLLHQRHKRMQVFLNLVDVSLVSSGGGRMYLHGTLFVLSGMSHAFLLISAKSQREPHLNCQSGLCSATSQRTAPERPKAKGQRMKLKTFSFVQTLFRFQRWKS